MKTKSRSYKRRLSGPLMWVQPPISKGALTLREKMVNQIKEFMMSTYMKNIITIPVSDSDLDAYPENMEDDIIREALRILRYNENKQFSFKSSTNDISMYCIIEPYDRSSDNIGPKPKCIIMAITYGPDMVISHTYLAYDKPFYSLSDVSGPVILAQDVKKANDFIGRNINTSNILPGDPFPVADTDDNFLIYLRVAIKTMRKYFNDESQFLPHRPSHTSMEMYAIKELYKVKYGKTGIPLSSIIEWTFKGSIKDNPGYDVIKKGRITPSLHTDENPLVALSERSFNSIIKYVKKNGYMFHDEYEGLKKNINMADVVSGSRYGSSFIYPVFANGEKINSQLVFSLHNDNGCLMIDIPCGEVYFILTVLFDNLREFNLYNNIITVDISAIVLNPEKLPCDADEGDILVPKEFRTLPSVMELIYRICGLFITIYERPTRTRVICERRRRFPSDGHIHENDEKDYVVRHIMKSASSARKYVKEMTGMYPDREYTMMSWDRAGHERHLASGGVTWVSGCKCHRRLPLSNKKIHLNL